MAWYKIDDQLHSHPKARRAGLEAMGLWTLAGSHCMSYLTDGFVEAWFVESWPHGHELADALVRESLWLEVPGGWQFHDWGEYQPTREKVESERAAATERKRKQREKGSDGRYMSRRDSRETGGERSSTPSPSPSPDYLLTESVSLGSNAREKSTDSKEQIESSKNLAAALKVDLQKVIDCASRIDRALTHSEALRLATFVLQKAKREPRNPMAYILSTFKNGPYEVQQWIDTEVVL